MSRNLSANADLAQKYAVGEIVDMAGVSGFYDTGSSKWMQGATWFPRTQVGNAVADLLSQTPSNGTLAPAERTNVNLGYITDCASPPAQIGSTVVFSMNSNAPGLLVLNESGFSMSPTPFGNTGYAVRVVSDGTYFWALSLGNKTKVYRSTDGLTWTAFDAGGHGNYTASNYLWPTGDSGYPYAPSYGRLTYFGYWVSNGGAVIEWLGARCLIAGHNTSNASVSRSANFTSWGGDEINPVMGATFSANTSLPSMSNTLLFHKGSTNKAFICDGRTLVRRFTSDGGVTWGDSAGASFSYHASYPYIRNKTNPDKFLLWNGSNYNQTADCGANWIARTFPGGSPPGDYGIAYSGTTIISCNSNGLVSRSNDDGATWTTVTLPSGVSGLAQSPVHDGYRFYMAMNSSPGTLLKSTDGLTWTICALPTSANISPSELKFCSFDADTPVFFTAGVMFYSLDAGVTWKAMGVNTSNNASATSFITNVTCGTTKWIVGVTYGNGTQYYFLLNKADFLTGAQYVRAGSSNPTALRGSTTPMIRVA